MIISCCKAEKPERSTSPGKGTRLSLALKEGGEITDVRGSEGLENNVQMALARGFCGIGGGRGECATTF